LHGLLGVNVGAKNSCMVRNTILDDENLVLDPFWREVSVTNNGSQNSKDSQNSTCALILKAIRATN